MSKHLVIVESPAKAKTIKRFLGKDFAVEASMGHIRDLPESTLGVDTEHDFTPEYAVPEEKQKVVRALKKALQEADDLWIATDEDREGEAIGWHLTQVLEVKDPHVVKRIVFHEITEDAIRAAVVSPRTIDMKLVDAQQARRVLDRLVGYTLSPFLWKKVYRGLSAGRVQSVAVRIIVDREREVRAFVPEEYWEIAACFETEKHEQFTAELAKVHGKKCVLQKEEHATAVLADLHSAAFRVATVEEKEIRKTPPPPFTTSTLQQEAARKLGFSVRQTMAVAQQLYEGVRLGKGEGMMGLITYMRTDSVHVSERALEDARMTIEKQFGREYVLAEPRRYKTKSRGAQEAHEAVRPTELNRTPQSFSSVLDHQQIKLYTLIWNRTMATQMPAAEFKRVGVDIVTAKSQTEPGYTFRATGQTVLFDGFLRVYQEGHDEGEQRDADDLEPGETLLPPLRENDDLNLLELIPSQHFTKPPPRYTEASLVKKLEEEGIGRPSTYAPTIGTIQQRGYIRKEGKQLVPEEVAFLVIDLLAEHFRDIVDLAFTARMEQSLDDIAEGKTTGIRFLRGFYNPFQELVAQKSQEIQKSDVMKERELGTDPATNLPVIVRAGRFGPYVQLGKFEKSEKGAKRAKTDAKKLKSASLPKHILMESVTLEQALSLLSFPRDLGTLEGKTLTVNLGRFGPYLKCDEATVALPNECNPLGVTFAQAAEILAHAQEDRKRAKEPLRTLGRDPETQFQVFVKIGRFGPYVTDGKTNASISKKLSPEGITLEEACALLQRKRERGPSHWRGRG